MNDMLDFITVWIIPDTQRIVVSDSPGVPYDAINKDRINKQEFDDIDRAIVYANTMATLYGYRIDTDWSYANES